MSWSPDQESAAPDDATEIKLCELVWTEGETVNEAALRDLLRAAV